MEVRPIDASALIDKLESINPVDYGAMSSYETHNGARDALSDATQCVNDAPTLSINTLRDEIYRDAVAHGLYERYNYYKTGDEDMDNRCLMRYLAIRIREETVELYDAVDIDNTKSYSEELADVVIMCFSVAGKLGIDIDAAIRRKMEINKGRTWKHGKE